MNEVSAELRSRGPRCRIRVAFAVPMRDRNYLAYGDPGPIAAALGGADFKSIADAIVRIPRAEQLAWVEAISSFEHRPRDRGVETAYLPRSARGMRNEMEDRSSRRMRTLVTQMAQEPSDDRSSRIVFITRRVPQRWVEALLDAIGAEVADVSLGPVKT